MTLGSSGSFLGVPPDGLDTVPEGIHRLVDLEPTDVLVLVGVEAEGVSIVGCIHGLELAHGCCHRDAGIKGFSELDTIDAPAPSRVPVSVSLRF